MIDTIVFSKNRAMQLDLLIRTATIYAPHLNLKCLYTYTNDKHKNSYEILQNEYPNVEFIFEQNTKEQIINAISTNLMCFLVDDDIFFKSIPTDINLNPFETYSVRLGKNITVKAHFAYKMSLDGNIFKSSTMKNFLKNLPKQAFRTPNYLESALVGNYNNKMSILYNTQCLVGVAHNRVSNSSGCSHSGKYDEHILCDKFLDGYRIFLKSDFDFDKIFNVHDDNIEFNINKVK